MDCHRRIDAGGKKNEATLPKGVGVASRRLSHAQHDVFSHSVCLSHPTPTERTVGLILTFVCRVVSSSPSKLVPFPPEERERIMART